MAPIRQTINGVKRKRFAEMLKGQYVKESLSVATLATDHGLSTKLVATLLGEVGTSMRSPSERPMPVSETKDITTRYKGGESIRTISSTTKHSYETIVRILDAAGIERRHHDAAMQESKKHRKRGSGLPGAKLDEGKVKIVRQLFAEGFGDRRIAKRFRVSKTAIRQVRIGRTWTHVD